MKRYVISLLVAVMICIPLLSIDGLAEELDMLKEMDLDNTLKPGYVYPYVKGLQGQTREVFFYYTRLGCYLNVSFEGDLLFQIDSWQLQYYMKFSNPSSVKVRLYECDGRNIFTLTPENKMSISFPAQKLADLDLSGMNIVGTTNGYTYSTTQQTQTGNVTHVLDYNQYSPTGGGSVTVIERDKNGNTIGSTVYPAAFFNDIVLQRDTENYNLKISGTTTSNSDFNHSFYIPDSHAQIMLNAISGTITQEEFAQSNFDYYIVQKEGSTIKTPLDYPLKYSFYDSMLMLDGVVGGIPVSVYSSEWSYGNMTYSTGSSYTVNSRMPFVTLYYIELLKGYPSLPLVVLNKYLTHFGYETIYYSAENEQLSNEISGLGDTMGGFTSQASSFSSQAGEAVAGVNVAVASFSPIFMKVWNVLPPWFLALLAVVLTIVVGRKILGR